MRSATCNIYLRESRTDPALGPHLARAFGPLRPELKSPRRPPALRACLACERSSASVGGRPLRTVAIVTHLVTRSLATASSSTGTSSAAQQPGTAVADRTSYEHDARVIYLQRT
jgi:hypothetical protein